MAKNRVAADMIMADNAVLGYLCSDIIVRHGRASWEAGKHGFCLESSFVVASALATLRVAVDMIRTDNADIASWEARLLFRKTTVVVA